MSKQNDALLHNKGFLSGIDETFAEDGMKAFCVLGMNDKNEIDMCVCDGVPAEALIEYFENTIKTLQKGKKSNK